MNSGIIIRTPLITFYFIFKIHNNTIFIKFNDTIYYSNYNEFMNNTEWYYLYNLSLFTSKYINNNLIIDVLWCLIYKENIEYIEPIKIFNYKNHLNKASYKPSLMINNLITNYLIRDIENKIKLLEYNIKFIQKYYQKIIFALYAIIDLKLNIDCIEYILLLI